MIKEYIENKIEVLHITAGRPLSLEDYTCTKRHIPYMKIGNLRGKMSHFSHTIFKTLILGYVVLQDDVTILMFI